MTAALSEKRAALLQASLLRRFGSVAEVVSAVQFVVDNEFITGQSIVVDGGFGLHAG